MDFNSIGKNSAEKISALMNGKFRIKSHDPNFCVQFRGDKNLCLGKFAGKPEQIFTLKPVKDDFYCIMQDGSDLVFDVNGAKTTDGTSIIMHPYHGGDNQLWKIVLSEDGKYVMFVSKHSGKCVDVYGATFVSGQRVHLYSANKTIAQKFVLEKVS